MDWLYLEGIFCLPTATLTASSTEEARKLARAWDKRLEGETVRTSGREVLAIGGEAYECEEAQGYTDLLEKFPKRGFPATTCACYFAYTEYFQPSVREALKKILGYDVADSDDHENPEPDIAWAQLRYWDRIPLEFPGGMMGVAGRLSREGLRDARVIFRDPMTRDMTDLMLEALADTELFMKDCRLKEMSPWFENKDVAWTAPTDRAAKVVCNRINEAQGHAKRKGRVVTARAGEIWSVVSWFKFARTNRVLIVAPDDPRLPELTGGDPGATPFASKVVCFTGKTVDGPRSGYQEMVKDFGGKVATTISKDVNLVVAGPGAGPSSGGRRRSASRSSMRPSGT
jgi:hypothetical protein